MQDLKGRAKFCHHSGEPPRYYIVLNHRKERRTANAAPRLADHGWLKTSPSYPVLTAESESDVVIVNGSRDIEASRKAPFDCATAFDAVLTWVPTEEHAFAQFWRLGGPSPGIHVRSPPDPSENLLIDPERRDVGVSILC